MLSLWSLILIALAYMALLFWIAWTGDHRRIGPEHHYLRATIYTLSLAVYCTSWTFYGAVGSAATTGWGFLPIYLGPALVFLFGYELLHRIAVTSRDQRITSIADYIAYRYGRSHAIAVLVVIAAVLASVPYIALQLKGITTGFEVIMRSVDPEVSFPATASFYLALALALFAILFGTRTLDASEHHRGLMWAVAFESLIKLLAFCVIGLFVVFWLFDGPAGIVEALSTDERFRELFSPWRLPEGFGVQLVLSMAAILCLPRQFHVAIVEFRDTRELRFARWVFPLYLMLFAALIVPIALGGLTLFAGQDVHPDTFVVALPLAAGRESLAALAFLGGFSAATGMVIVATVALAIMISNDIVMPLLLRSGLARRHAEPDLSAILLNVRRVSIVAVTLLAYAYYHAIEAGVPLASIGLLAFAAAAQFAPAMLIGLYWRGASRAGALAGLSLGVTSWFFLLLLPSFSSGASAWMPFAGLDFNHGAAWSLALNAAAVLLLSLLVPDARPIPERGNRHAQSGGMITLGDLQDTIGRFLGVSRTREALASHLGTARFEDGALATPATIQFGERMLAGSIGSASARTVLTTALFHRGLGAEDVLDLLDRASQAVQFNRELLESTLDNLSQGVAVVDNNLRLVGWNRRYIELMQYPEGMVTLGQPIEELLRFNARRGLLGDGDTGEADVRRRLEHLRSGDAYRYERQWLDGKVMEIQGNPMPGGGYVTTYTDISRFKDIERELQEINETLEQRVLQRTHELSDAFREVEEARQSAEAANASKTRFLAAASHDLLQPMNAARLFVSILREQHPGDDDRAKLVKRVDRSLSAAEELLSALLDISKLDSGTYQPELEIFALDEVFEQLRRRFKPLAANRGLELRVRPSGRSVYSDRKLLYRILQNFLSNAIRYTEQGGVLLGCRRLDGELCIGVWDTGVGLQEEDHRLIFQEFQRLEYAQRQDERGLGLGLAICERIARVLGHRIRVQSRAGRGSLFSVSVPLAAARPTVDRPAIEARAPDNAPLRDLAVLCIDNEQDILDGMRLLLERWGCRVRLARDRSGVEVSLTDDGNPDMLLVDYHLDDRCNGLDLLMELERRLGALPPVIIVTADRSSEVEAAVRQKGFGLLRKPIKPAALRSLVTRLAEQRREDELSPPG